MTPNVAPVPVQPVASVRTPAREIAISSVTRASFSDDDARLAQLIWLKVWSC